MTSTRVKFDKIQRRKLRGAMRKLIAHGTTNRKELTDKLNADGFTAPNGSPLKLTQVQSQLTLAGIGRLQKRRKSKTVVPDFSNGTSSHTSEKDALLDLVIGSRLPADTKIKILKSIRG